MRNSLRTSVVRSSLVLAGALAAFATAPAFGASPVHDTFGPNGEMYIGADCYPEKGRCHTRLLRVSQVVGCRLGADRTRWEEESEA